MSKEIFRAVVEFNPVLQVRYDKLKEVDFRVAQVSEAEGPATRW